MIRIISKKDGFFRCGVKHNSNPTDYPNDRFTSEQIERLKAEPMLIVFEVTDPPPVDPVASGEVKNDSSPEEPNGKKKR